MTTLLQSPPFVIAAILLMPVQIIGTESTHATEKATCSEQSGSCKEPDPIDRTEGTYKMGKPDFSPNQKPNAFWASKPTGKFTKEEIFHVCAQTAMLGYTALDARLKGEPKSKLVDRLSTIMTGTFENKHQSLREREPVLYERARKLFIEIGGKLYDTAYNGGEHSLANLIQRDGFEQFYPKLISGCYRNLASW